MSPSDELVFIIFESKISRKIGSPYRISQTMRCTKHSSANPEIAAELGTSYEPNWTSLDRLGRDGTGYTWYLQLAQTAKRRIKWRAVLDEAMVAWAVSTPVKKRKTLSNPYPHKIFLHFHFFRELMSCSCHCEHRRTVYKIISSSFSKLTREKSLPHFELSLLDINFSIYIIYSFSY